MHERKKERQRERFTQAFWAAACTHSKIAAPVAKCNLP